MNQTISQQYPFEYSDNDCLGQDRTFPGSLLSNDYLQQPPYRRDASRNQSSAQSVPLPINPPSKHSSHSSLHDSSFLSASALLSPPDSLSGSVSASTNQASSVNFPQLPKLNSNNVSSADPFQPLPASYSQYSFGGMETSMTDFSRPRHTLHPASLSPPLTFGSGHSISGGYLGHPRPEPYHPAYFLNNPQPPANFNDITKFRNRGPDPYGPPFNSNPIMYNTQTPQHEGSARVPPACQDGGPPFEETKTLYHVVTGRNHQQLSPEVIAGIQKGFFKVEGKWTCYRRNYFTVTCSFSLKNQVVDGPFFLNRGSQLEQITRFAVAISAKTATVNNQESEARSLVQHTPKRDKISETTPKLQVIQPAPVNTMTSTGSLGVNNHAYGVTQHISSGSMSSFDPFGSAQHQQPPVSHTFERIQFQKATANNGKRRAQQQYFHVVVELMADIGRPGGSEHWMTIATKQSAPMVVRGRSPGHYKDNARRDSTTSMDPDRGGGGGGDSSNSQLHMGPLLGSQSHNNQMDWSSSHRHGGHYGGSNYHSSGAFGYSPISGSSSPFTTSPTELDSEILETSQVSPPRSSSTEDSTLPFHFQGERLAAEESFPFRLSPRKRRFDEVFVSSEVSYVPGQASSDGMPQSTFDYSTGPRLKAVCAS